MTSKDKFLSRAKKTRPIDIDGEPYLIKKLSQGDLETVRQRYSAADKQAESLRFTVCRCLLNADGERMFTDADMGAIAAMDFDEIKRIAEAVSNFTGLTVPEKND